MGVFRSEKMLLCQILFSQETTFDCVECLGNLGLVEFRDLNASVTQYQRSYVADIRRYEEMERKLRVLEQEIKKSQTAIMKCTVIPPAPGAKETLSLESNLETLVGEIQNVNRSTNVLKRNLLELIEQYHVLRKAGACLQSNHAFFEEEPIEATTTDIEKQVVREKPVGKLKITTGIIAVEKIKGFEMILWRLGRGVAYYRVIHITEVFIDPTTDAKLNKAVFVIACHGDSLNKKILKICQAFRCHLHYCPTNSSHRKDLEREAIKDIKETEQVMQSTSEHQARVLMVAASHLETWKHQVLKSKSIFHVMNTFQLDATNEFILAECWLPEQDMHYIKMNLNAAAGKANNKNDPIIIIMRHNEEPPTFNRTNDFTRGFQNLIDAYGISSYREMNPMPYTVVTFPFLFAVMFGDLGHGLVLTIFAAFMIIYQKKLKRKKIEGEIERIFFNGRFIILLMGIFSCYTGIIYNDMFAKSFNMFGSAWFIKKEDIHGLKNEKHMELDPVDHYTGYPYWMGMDPVWQISENKILFLNSYKMKLSIILGVCHMLFGIILSITNHCYFRNYIDIYTKFIPEVLFFCCLFGYLVVLIFIKWIKFGPFNEEKFGIHCAPNVLITFINMVLFKEESNEKCSPYMYENQKQLQIILVLVGLTCVPWLLCAKTIILAIKRKARSRKPSREVFGPGPADKVVVREKHEEPMGEIMIHQGIETIEFVLGSVSHTASYLRLWALSLAHAQLSDVLWKMVLKMGFTARGPLSSFSLVLIFLFWSSLTVSILVMMEGLSAFLHTLRLHWVEFQSKFFSAAGRPFRPFSFENILKEETL